MAKSKSKNTDVIELDAEEVPLEKTIENALVKQNVTEHVIAGLKEKFGGLTLKSLDDKESYLEIKESRKVVRQWGILAEKVCKTGREDAIKVQKLWLSKEKEILGKIAEVQDPLDDEIKKFEDEQERIAQDKIRKQDEQNIQRQATLSKLGATYQDGHFVLNHISYEAVLIKDSDSDIWETSILPKYQSEYKKNEAEKFAQEKKREEEALALKKQQEEMDRQRKELEEQRAAFKKQQDELQQQREKVNALIREEEEKKAAEERKHNHDLQMKRLNLLLPVNPYGSDVDMSTLWTLSEPEFDRILQTKTQDFDKQKKRDEDARLAKIEEDKKIAAEAAVQQERDRIERERVAAQELIEVNKKLQAEELEKAGDRAKWNHFLIGLKVYKYPEMKHGTYKGKIADAKKLIDKIINL